MFKENLTKLSGATEEDNTNPASHVNSCSTQSLRNAASVPGWTPGWPSLTEATFPQLSQDPGDSAEQVQCGFPTKLFKPCLCILSLPQHTPLDWIIKVENLHHDSCDLAGL
jgi:hypothetical protein